MKRQSVNSSMIRAIGFEDGVMEIEFPNGHVYRYTGPKVQAHYDALIAAESVGKHFSAQVRKCPETACELVEPVNE